jgi:hypothetical protein
MSPIMVVILDACCLLNLYASRHMLAILQILPMRFVIAEAAGKESLFVYRGGQGPDAQTPEAVDLAPAFNSGLLTVVSIDTETEGEDYLAFAADLDDGEAMSCAIAKHRGYAIATDDRKALSLIRRGAPQIQVFTTMSLLKQWADATEPELVRLREVLTAIRQRGRFFPPASDPLRPGWDAALGTAS